MLIAITITISSILIASKIYHNLKQYIYSEEIDIIEYIDLWHDE